ncbi:MAG: hypothetical protein ABIQ06_14325 [Caldimonas sp.]
MGLVDGIRTVGFRKWYQGELTRSHISLVLLLLSSVGALVSLELSSRQAPMSDRIGSLVLMLVCAAIGAVALRRYMFLLMRAEQAAREAVCPGCATYGRLELAGDGPRPERMEVRCRGCRHVWSMSDVGDE